MKKYRIGFMILSVVVLIVAVKKGVEEKDKPVVSLAVYNNSIEEKKRESLEPEKIEKTEEEKDWSEKKVYWEIDNYTYGFERRDNWTKEVEYGIEKEKASPKGKEAEYPKIVDKTGRIENLTELNRELLE